MPEFGARSETALATCHPDLQCALRAAIAHVDFSVIEGHRSLERQQALYAQGRSSLDGITRQSLHQRAPSLAVDILPWPPVLHGVNVWDDITRFAYLVGRIRGVADQLGISLRCGLDWDDDGSLKNHRFVDAPHLELAGAYGENT